MKAFFWLCFLLLIPGLLVRVDAGGAGILPSDILLPLLAASYLFKKWALDRNWSKTSFWRPGVVFLVVAVGSFFLGASELLWKEQVLSFAYIIRFFSLLVFGVMASDLFAPRSPNDSFRALDSFFVRLFCIIFVVLVLGIIQFYVFPDISNWSTEGGWDPHIGRLLGTWMDPNFIAGLISFLLPVIAGYWYEHKKSSLFSAICGGFLLLCLYCLFLTFSRSGYLAGVIGLTFFFLFRNPKVLLVGALLATIGVASNQRAQQRLAEFSGTLGSVILGDTDEIDPTAKLRFQSWQESFSLFQKYPVLGIGFNTYRYRAAEEGIVDESYFSAGGSDSSLLTILVTTGILGFATFIYFWGKLFFCHFFRYWRRRSSEALYPSLSLGLASGILALLVHSVFVNSLLFPLILLVVMAVVGLLDTEQKNSVSPTPPPPPEPKPVPLKVAHV